MLSHPTTGRFGWILAPFVYISTSTVSRRRAAWAVCGTAMLGCSRLRFPLGARFAQRCLNLGGYPCPCNLPVCLFHRSDARVDIPVARRHSGTSAGLAGASHAAKTPVMLKASSRPCNKSLGKSSGFLRLMSCRGGCRVGRGAGVQFVEDVSTAAKFLRTPWWQWWPATARKRCDSERLSMTESLCGRWRAGRKHRARPWPPPSFERQSFDVCESLGSRIVALARRPSEGSVTEILIQGQSSLLRLLGRPVKLTGQGWLRPKPTIGQLERKSPQLAAPAAFKAGGTQSSSFFEIVSP